MTKFVSSLIVCGALTTASLSATEINYEQDVAPSVPSVMFGHAPQKLDLISIASNGAVTEQSKGVYVLSALEMQEVQGGSRIGKVFRKNKTRIKYGVFSGVLTAVTGGSASLIVVHTVAGAATKKVHF
ncbi:MAG: hypothetical protein K2O85_05500 [Helicobacter sp.]|nr:hypothetical protein [Helicobacter sp.]